MNHHAQAKCSTEQIVSATSIFRLIPAGLFRASDGRPSNIAGWSINKTTATAIIDAANTRANDFVIDYEHQTLNAGVNGAPAPAAGWFKRMQWRDGDGLYVIDARWTDTAAMMIAAREYRYISPVFTFDKDGNLSSILSAALTNTPALDGLTDLAAARHAGFQASPEARPRREAESAALTLSRQALEHQREQAAAGVFITAQQAVDHVSCSVMAVKRQGREAELAGLALSRQALAYQREQAAAGVFVSSAQAVNHVSKGGVK